MNPKPKWQVVNEELYNGLREKVTAFLDEFHREQKHIKGVRRSDLRSRLMPNAAQVLFEKLLLDLSDSGEVKVEGELVWKSGHVVTFTPRQVELKEKIIALYQERLFNPPELSELAEETGMQASEIEPITTGLFELGDLVRLHGPDGKAFFFHRDAIAKAEEHHEERFKKLLKEVEAGTVLKKRKKSGGFAENAVMFILEKNYQKRVLLVTILKVSTKLSVNIEGDNVKWKSL